MSEVQGRTEPATLVVRAPETYVEERKYVLDVVLSEWLGLRYDLEFDDRARVAIRLAGDADGSELTLPDVLFATPPEDWLTERSMPAERLAQLVVDEPVPGGEFPASAVTALDGSSPAGGDSPGVGRLMPLPILFGVPDRPGWHRTAAGLGLDVDVFGSVFFLLTRYEEVVTRVRDEHDRFPATASLAALNGFLERPIADEYVDLLWAALRSSWPALRRRPSTFRLRLTHDVDQPWSALGRPIRAVARGVARDLLGRRDPALAAARVRSLVDAKSGRVDRDPLNTFDLLMDTSERHGLRSVFYFMAGNLPGDEDFRYRLSDPIFAPLLRRIHDRGHEVGLHTSYGSHGSAERIRREFEALRAACRGAGFEQPAWGVRQHYLRLANPQTWRNQEAAGLEHDSTLGFAERIGFRAGTCREYPLFDLTGRRRLRLRERPLAIMDATLFEYMGLGPDDATSRASAVVDACRRHQGDAVVLFHNSSLPGARERAYYRRLVDVLARSD